LNLTADMFKAPSFTPRSSVMKK